jgi:hypothetical protein
MRTYLARTAGFQNSTVGRPHGSLAAYHVGAIAHHQDTDEGVAVDVPANDRLVVDQRAVCNIFSGALRVLALVERVQLLFDLSCCLLRQVDMSDLIVHLRNQIHCSNGGNDCQSLWVVPSLIGEGGMPIKS